MQLVQCGVHDGQERLSPLRSVASDREAASMRAHAHEPLLSIFNVLQEFAQPIGDSRHRPVPRVPK